MAQGRDTAEWEWSHWAGTPRQLAEAARIASERVAALHPFPEGTPDPEKYDRERDAAEHAAERARQVEIVVEESDGYTGEPASLDDLAALPPHTVARTVRITIEIGGGGYALPGVTIRASSGTLKALSVRISGRDRTWTAGLRHELERALRPQWRLHGPLMTNPMSFPFVCVGVGLAVYVALAGVLTATTDWERRTRLLVAFGGGVVAALAFGPIALASAKQFELLPEGGLPRYQRWRIKVYAWVGAVVLGVIGSAVYALLSGD